MAENGGGKKAVDVSGRGVVWTEWGRHRSGLHVVNGGPRSVPPGESWGVLAPAAAMSLVTRSVGTHPCFPSRYFLGAGYLGPVSPAPGTLTFSSLSAHSLQAIKTL